MPSPLNPNHPSLPFTIAPRSPHGVVVGDEINGALSIPTFGSLLVGELLEYQQALQAIRESGDSIELQDVRVRVLRATILMRSRVCPEWSEADTLRGTWRITLPSGEVAEARATKGLIDALTRLWLHEQTEWEPEDYVLVAVGEKGLEACTRIAKEINGEVATRPDMSSSGTYYAYRAGKTPKDAGNPMGWYVVESFAGGDAPAAPEKPKGKASRTG